MLSKVLKEIPKYIPFIVILIYITGYIGIMALLNTYGIYESVAFDIREITAGCLYYFINLPLLVIIFLGYKDVRNGKDFFLSLIDIKLLSIPIIVFFGWYLSHTFQETFFVTPIIYYFFLLSIRAIYHRTPNLLGKVIILIDCFIPQVIMAVLDSNHFFHNSNILRFYYLAGYFLCEYVIVFFAYKYLKKFLYLVLCLCLMINIESILFFGRALLPIITRAYGGQVPLFTRMFLKKDYIKSIPNSQIQISIKDSTEGAFKIVFDTESKYYIANGDSLVYFIPKSDVLTYEEYLSPPIFFHKVK